MAFENSRISPEVSTAEMRKNAEWVLKISSKGKENSTNPETGDHATSVEALRAAVRTGVLPGTTTPKTGHHFGDLFFAPRVGKLRKLEVRQALKQVGPMSQEDVENYAGIVGQKHYIMDQLGLQLDDAEADRVVSTLLGETRRLSEIAMDEHMWDEETRAFVSRYGLHVLDALVEESRKRKGVVVSLKKSAQRYGVELGDPGWNDAKIPTGGRSLPCLIFTVSARLAMRGGSFLLNCEKNLACRRS